MRENDTMMDFLRRLTLQICEGRTTVEVARFLVLTRIQASREPRTRKKLRTWCGRETKLQRWGLVAGG